MGGRRGPARFDRKWRGDDSQYFVIAQRRPSRIRDGEDREYFCVRVTTHEDSILIKLVLGRVSPFYFSNSESHSLSFYLA